MNTADRDIESFKKQVHNLIGSNSSNSIDTLLLKGLVTDFIHNQKKKNLLNISLESGIIDHIQISKVVSPVSFIKQCKDTLRETYGIADNYAEWVARVWLYIFNKGECPEDLERFTKKVGETPNNSYKEQVYQYKNGKSSVFYNYVTTKPRSSKHVHSGTHTIKKASTKHMLGATGKILGNLFCFIILFVLNVLIFAGKVFSGGFNADYILSCRDLRHSNIEGEIVSDIFALLLIVALSYMIIKVIGITVASLNWTP